MDFRITVVIPTYNRCEDLRSTCQQLHRLDPAPDEIIVCLDGCTDSSRDMLASEFPGYCVIENDVARGSIPSRDRAFRMASGDLIISLDDDSYPLQPDFIVRVRQSAVDHPEAGIFCFQEVRSEWPVTYKPPQQQHIGHYVNNYANCAGAIRRSLYGEGVTYPTLLFHMYEEPDSCLQAYGAGYAVWYEPSILIFHHASPIARNVIGRHHLNARNEFWSVILRCPLPHCLWVAPYRVMRQFIHAAFNGWVWIKKEPCWWVSAASGIGQCLKDRQPVPWKIYWNWMNLTRRPVVAYDELLRRFYTIADRRQGGSSPR